MDITVYLPDEIGASAKQAHLPLSRMLRDAVEAELDRRATLEFTLSDGIEEHEVELEEHTGVITGKFLGEFPNAEQVYVTDDERVLVYDEGRRSVRELDDPAKYLADWYEADPSTSEDAATMARALGLRLRVRL